MTAVEATFVAELWQWQGPAAWHFVTVPADLSDDIREQVEGRTGGFGSVRVELGVGATTWRTSLFPDSATGCYLLPVKRAVREAEGLVEGEPVTVRLEVLG